MGPAQGSRASHFGWLSARPPAPSVEGTYFVHKAGAVAILQLDLLVQGNEILLDQRFSVPVVYFQSLFVDLDQVLRQLEHLFVQLLLILNLR